LNRNVRKGSDGMTGEHETPAIDPALAESAPLGLDLSEQFCDAACREYHGVWGFLRLYGVLPAVSREAAFLRARVSEALTAGARRVLISGTADFGILAHVAEGIADSGQSAEITVADLCPTPLKLSEWYAARNGFRIATAAGNILNFQGGPFDLIVAHNFLNFFAPIDRAALAAKWAELLAPGGRLLAYNRVKPGAPDRSRRFDDAGTARLIERLRAALRGHPHAGVIDAARLETLVAGYARKKHSHNVKSEAELVALLDGAGFELSSCTAIANHAPGTYSDQGGLLMEVVAVKPA
jgi:SAM-dependent methyltransferase